jgi:uncharacterized repeat protein (TIGR01451 family)
MSLGEERPGKSVCKEGIIMGYIMPPDGSISCLQEIAAPGKKLALKKLKILVVLGLLAVFALYSQLEVESALAEGSRNFFPNPPADPSARRAHLEWRTSSYGPITPTDNSILRRTLLRVYVNAGEFILMGSSSISSTATPANIVLYPPGQVTGRTGQETLGTPIFDCNTQRTAIGPLATMGRITSRAQELAGPQAIAGGGNPGGYVPCYYQVPAGGIYSVAFYGVAGGTTDSQVNPSGNIPAEYDLTSPLNFAPPATDSSVAAWDVTVRSTNTATTDINGRVFAYYLAMITGGNSRPVFPVFTAITRDGYRYETNLNGLDPNGFLIYGNRSGFLDSDGVSPLYHNVIGQDPTNPQLLRTIAGGGAGGINFAIPEWPIFFNNTNADPNGTNATLTALGTPIAPTLPVISNLSFAGTLFNNISRLGTGGTIRYNINVTGRYQIVLSRDGVNFDPANPLNRTFRGEITTPGQQNIAWDGRDNAGAVFPVNTLLNPYIIRMRVTAGEYHLPLLDVENNIRGGPIFTLRNATNPLGQNVGFYDDRGYVTRAGVTVGIPATQGNSGVVLCPGNVPVGNPRNPNPPSSDAFSGFNTSTNQRGFGDTGSGNLGNENVACNIANNAYPAPVTNPPRYSGFGDVKGLDLWTLFPSNELRTPLFIVSGIPRMIISKDDGKTQVSRQERLDYTIGFANNSDQAPPTPPAPGTATNVTIVDTIPPNTTFLRCQVNAPFTGSCSLSGSTVTFTIDQPVVPGASGSVLVSVEVNPNAPSGNITNVADLTYRDQTGTTYPPVRDDDTDFVRLPDATPAPSPTTPPGTPPPSPTPTVGSPRLNLGKDDGKTVVTQTEQLDYIISFNNVSNNPPPDPPTPGIATAIVLRDNIPPNTTYLDCAVNAPLSGSCSFGGGVVTFQIDGTLAPGEGGSVRVSVRVNEDAPAGDIANSVTLEYKDDQGRSQPPITTTDVDTIPPRPTTTPDPTTPPPTTPPPLPPTPTPGDGGGGVPTPNPNSGPFDPYIVKVADSPQALPGQTVRFTITFTNRGSETIENLVITDNVPPEFGVTGATSSQGAVNISGQRVTVNVGTLPPGGEVTIVITTLVQRDTRGNFVNPVIAEGTVNGVPYKGYSQAEVMVPGLPNTGSGFNEGNVLISWLVVVALVTIASGALFGIGLSQNRKKRA